MAKQKTMFCCQDCGYESAKWLGRCPGCSAWNSMVEEVVQLRPARSAPGAGLHQEGQVPLSIVDVEISDMPRFATASAEFDRVLGGGVIPGSMVLIVGDPGVGKSSLTLKSCAHVAQTHGKVLYVTGEESNRQIRMRADRLQAVDKQLFVLSETNLDIIEQQTIKLKPNLLVIDSIQTMFRPELSSAPGSVSQVRESAVQLLRLAKYHGIAIFVVGHVTKDGALAGPRVLEHIVDTVLYFEGERNAQFRVLRAVKNRFGSTNEIGLFEMRGQGLIDVADASGLFLSERPIDVPGSVVVPTVEGTRPLLVEIQALVSQSPFMPPRRTADHVDIKRIQLLLAVLEKRVGMLLGTSDVYVKIAGGIKVDEPAVDLGLTMALASSFRNRNIIESTVFIGEVGLAGEVRTVSQIEVRLREAAKMGFKRVVLPKGNLKNAPDFKSLALISVETLGEALEAGLE